MELSKVTKLLRLMQLLSTNTGYSIDGLMEKTGLSRRNIYNYLDTFRQAGFAVMKTGATGNTYRLVPSSNTPDLAHITYFTEEEAAFLNMLTDSLGIGDGNAISERVKHKLASIDYSGLNVPLVAVCNVPPIAFSNVPPQKWLL